MGYLHMSIQPFHYIGVAAVELVFGNTLVKRIEDFILAESLDEAKLGVDEIIRDAINEAADSGAFDGPLKEIDVLTVSWEDEECR